MKAATARKPSPGCARSPESNGRIGMYGFSYQGMTQLLAAAEQPEGFSASRPA
jgi:predicted acyl esterase